MGELKTLVIPGGTVLAMCQCVEVAMRWLVGVLLSLVVFSVGSKAEAQQFFPDPQAQALQIRDQLAMNEDARREFRRDQLLPNRMIRVGAPIFALGVGALAADAMMVFLGLSGVQSTPAQLGGIFAAGITMAVTGLVMMLRGRRLRVRSEQSFDTRYLMLRDQLREARRLRVRWD